MGLNDVVADLTIEYVDLTEGPGNQLRGAIGGIAVFDRALTGEQMRDLA